MEWLLIAVLLLAAFGGVAYVLPSKFQRLVGSLRLNARQRGFFVSSRSISDLDADAEDRVTSGGKARELMKLCVEYGRPFSKTQGSAPCWQLVRYKKSQLPIPGWLLKDNALEGVQLSDVSYWADVAEAISKMPDLCRSVDVNAHSVSWIGTESKSAVLENRFLDELESGLEALSSLNIEKAFQNQTNESL